MHKSTRLRIAALFVILNIVILNAIVLVFLVKSDGPNNGMSECVQKTKSVELCATAYR